MPGCSAGAEGASGCDEAVCSGTETAAGASGREGAGRGGSGMPHPARSRQAQRSMAISRFIASFPFLRSGLAQELFTVGFGRLFRLVVPEPVVDPVAQGVGQVRWRR